MSLKFLLHIREPKPEIMEDVSIGMVHIKVNQTKSGQNCSSQIHLQQMVPSYIKRLAMSVYIL